MKAKKWVLDKVSYYIDIETDDLCGTVPKDLEETAVCANCGRKLPYGDCYTSIEYFDVSGLFGLCVCPECHRAEHKRDFEHRLKNGN